MKSSDTYYVYCSDCDAIVGNNKLCFGMFRIVDNKLEPASSGPRWNYICVECPKGHKCPIQHNTSPEIKTWKCIDVFRKKLVLDDRM
jgi:hypothetical protein